MKILLKPLAAFLGTALFAFSCASCSAPQPQPDPQPQPSENKQPIAELKIMSFNVLNGWNTTNIGTRDDATAAKILELMPDVLSLQEFDDYYRNALGKPLTALISETYAEVGSEEKSWNPIFYNKSTLELVQCGHENYSVGTSYASYNYKGEIGSKFRTISWALLRHKTSGKQFLVCNTHLDVEEEKQPLQVSELNGKVEELMQTFAVDNVFLTGDLNSNTSSQTAQSLFDFGFWDTHERATIKDNLHSCGKQGEPITATYRGAIDHVYCIGNSVAVSNYMTVTDIRDASDHCPILVTLTIN